MSIITPIGGGIISIMETDIVCPVCAFEFDCSDKADKAKHPLFNMKCPACKSKLKILMPIFGGTTQCWEADVPKNVERLTTKSPFCVNGIPVKKKIFDDDKDDEDFEEVDSQEPTPPKPKLPNRA